MRSIDVWVVMWNDTSGDGLTELQGIRLSLVSGVQLAEEAAKNRGLERDGHKLSWGNGQFTVEQWEAIP